MVNSEWTRDWGSNVRVISTPISLQIKGDHDTVVFQSPIANPWGFTFSIFIIELVRYLGLK